MSSGSGEPSEDPQAESDEDALAPRWRGQAPRLEVWYATLSDPATGIGVWVHHELVAPDAGGARAQGWAALFAPGEAPVLERFGPEPVGDASGFASTASARCAPGALSGTAGRLSWDLAYARNARQRALFTFPSWAWRREVLPGAQVVPVASAPFTGWVAVDGRPTALSSSARGAMAHIYGHGSAQRWGWLHAELGGGDVLEVVSAVSRRAGLDRLPPLSFVQLRHGGRDWPRDPLVAAPLFRSRLGLPRWELRGTVGRRRLRVAVDIAGDRAVEVGYVDPDGSTATCTNSERADAEIVLEHRRATWEVEGRWALDACAHAEIGVRP